MWHKIKNEDIDLHDLFPSDYSFYDSERKLAFEVLFYDHYFEREIGFETYSLFEHKLKSKLNMIMPKYKMLYETKSLIIDPLQEFEWSEVYTKDESDTSSSSGFSSGTTKYDNTSGTESESINSDTPQGYLTPSDLKNHATDVSVDRTDNTSLQKGDTSSNTQASAERESLENLNRTVKGTKGKTQMELLNQYRDLFMNIDKMIIDECADLFMGVF